MTQRTIAVSGAASPLGRRVVDRLLRGTDHRIVELVSPRSSSAAAGADARSVVIRAALDEPLAADVAAALRHAHAIFHLAWNRDPSRSRAAASNRRMIEQLLDAAAEPRRFHFVSTISASPRAPGTYGAGKHEASQLVRARGGNVVVCGLVVEPDPATGAYARLLGLVRDLPLSLRFTGAGPTVAPVRLEDVTATFVHLSHEDIEPDVYRLFDPGAPGLNGFLELLERMHPRRRLRLRLSTPALLRAARLARRLALPPRSAWEQLLTLFFCDREHLAGHRPLPWGPLAACRDESFFGAGSDPVSD